MEAVMSTVKVSNRCWAFNKNIQKRRFEHTRLTLQPSMENMDVLVSVCVVERFGKVTQTMRSVQEGLPCTRTIAGI